MENINFKLAKHQKYKGINGPLLFIILDGVGVFKGRADGYPGNSVDIAHMPLFKSLLKDQRISTQLKAHGTAVGMPSDSDQGNSEVGHNAIGAGRIFDQGAKLVDKGIATRSLFEGNVWKECMEEIRSKKSAMHLIGLISDGNVHSHIKHLFAIIQECEKENIERLYVHGLLDGRDVEKRSAVIYFKQLDDLLQSINDNGSKKQLPRQYAIASGGGRMVTTMDRYESDWSIVQRGWEAHVLGRGWEPPDKEGSDFPKSFPDAITAINTIRKLTDQDDQYLPHWVIHGKDGKPIGTIKDGDVVIFFNFRGDRAIEISRAFTEEKFNKFDREFFPKVHYAGMMEYDGDLHIPPKYLVEPPAIDRTISEYLAKNGIPQFAIAETQKFGHVTYFWNGNNSQKFVPELEEWVEITSDRIAFDKAPEMKAKEVTERLVQALNEKKYRFLRVNFANGDMVGHTGNLKACVTAMETIDICLGRIKETIDSLGGTMIVTADHGNCEEKFEADKKGVPLKNSKGEYIIKTSHTLNPVPFIIYGPDTSSYSIRKLDNPGLGNMAATILNLLGFQAPEFYLPPLIDIT